MSESFVEELAAPKDSDDDTISITSTAASEMREEYPLEAILAEIVTEDGEMQYLVKWEGYPETRSTWEPVTSFLDGDSFREWEAQKMRIAQGYADPFDLPAFQARFQSIEDVRWKRKERRKLKRKKLGFAISSEDDDDQQRVEILQQESRDEAEEWAEDGHPEGSQYTTKKDATASIRQRGNDSDDAMLISSRKPRSKRRRRSANVDDEAALSDDSLIEDIRAKGLRKNNGKQRAQRGFGDEFVTEEVHRYSPPRLQAPCRSIAKTETREALSPIKGDQAATGSHMARRGRGPARLSRRQPEVKSKPNVQGAAILGNWNAPRKPRKRNSLPPEQQPDVNPQRFGKLSIAYKYAKAGRNEPAPNPDALTFFNLKEGKIVPSAAIRTANIRRNNPFEMSIEEHVSHVEDNDTDNMRFADDTTFSSTRRSTAIAAPAPPPIGSPSPRPLPPPLSPPPRKRNCLSLATYVQRRPVDRTTSSDPNQPPVNARNTPIVAESQMSPPTTPTSAASTGLDTNSVFAKLKTGMDNTVIGHIQINGFATDFRARWLITMGAQPELWFRHACIAVDFQRYYSKKTTEMYASGDLQSVGVGASSKALETLVDLLKVNGSGGLYLHNHFTMLIHPVTDAWSFLESPMLSPKAKLQFQIFKPTTDMTSYRQLKNSSLEEATIQGELDVITIFQQMFNITYKNLLPQSSQKGQDVNKVYLMGSSRSKDERDVTIKFLEASGATVHTSSTPGSWDSFSHQVELGVVLIHPSFCHYHSIPGLTSVLKKGFNVFSFGIGPDSETPRFTCTRLFPAGGVVLLTDSLISTESVKANQVVQWFVKYLKGKPAGTWKLVTRPNLKDSLLDAPMSKGDGRAGMWLALDTLEQSFTTLEGSPGIVNDDAPLVWPDDLSSSSPDVCENLVEWFAGWASMKATDFRRFLVVYSAAEKAKSKDWRKWSTIEALTPAELLATYQKS